MSKIFEFTAGVNQSSCKICFVGEAFGETEDALKLPFVGHSGIELTRMLFEANSIDIALEEEITANFYNDKDPRRWIDLREEWLSKAGYTLTNVLALRPLGNKMENVSVAKAALPPGYPPLKAITNKPKTLYLSPEYLDEPRRCLLEIEALRPNLVVALGNTALWLLLQRTDIGSVRGATAMSDTNGGLGGLTERVKVLPTYHPAGVMRNWSWRPIVVADLMKATREGEFPDIRRPKRRVIVNPTLEEVQNWTRDTLRMPPPWLAPDCETKGGTITCIGFARRRDDILVVPFAGPHEGSYWATPQEELSAWDCVAALLESTIPKVFQNGLYDLQYILPMGIRPRNLEHDTMLLHHSLFPEMQKGLGFLGSVYTAEASWKLMRRKRPDSEKRDE